jgi:type IV secretion/conjugal transfer VirB4 family ATPase
MLAEHRRSPQGVADLLNWAFMVDDGIILQKDGALLSAFAYRGPDVTAATDAERAALSRTVNEALLVYGDDWCWHLDAVRRPAVPYPASEFPCRAAALIDEERRASYASAGRRYETSYVLSVAWLPPSEADSRARSLLLSGRRSHRVDWNALLSTYARALRALSDRLGARLVLEPLGADALVTHLHGCLTGSASPLRAPPDGSYLNLALATQELVGGFEPTIGGRSIRCVAVMGWPELSSPGVLEPIANLSAAYRWSHRILPLSQATAARLIRRHQLRWFQKRKGAAEWVHEMVNSREASRDTQWLDNDATRMAHDAARAADENASGRTRFCVYNAIAVVIEDDPVTADAVARAIVRAYGDAGFGARIETVNAVDAFLGTLPGHGAPNVRRPVVSGAAIADLVPVTSTWPGLAHNPCPYYPVDSPPLLWAATDGSTPFRVNLHVSDVGHAMIVGQTGAGKSTLVGLLTAQFLRYAGARVFLFDVGYSSWVLCHALGGRHVDLAAGGATALQPLRHVDDPVERAWCAEWVEGLAGEVDRRSRNAVERALTLLAGCDPANRTLAELQRQVQDLAVAAALVPYVAGGSFSGVLDGVSDASEAESHYTVYELRSLLDMDDRVLVPTLLALFHQVERRLDGRPALIVIEEVWAPLLKSAFAARIKQWLLTLRKQNAAVVLVAHNVTQLSQVPIIWESCPTRIYLPNADAESPETAAIYAGLGLTAREISCLARATPKRDYYFTSPRGSRLFELSLGPIARAVLASGETTRARATRAMREHGAAWLDHWLGGSDAPVS